MKGMCGRFAVTTDPALLAAHLDALDETGPSAGPRYNVAPTDTIDTVVARHHEPGDTPTRRVRSMRWGLVPPWAKSAGAGPPLFNARAETLTTSPAFRASAQYKRCLVPMDGYYEWRAEPSAGKKGAKTPFYLHRADGGLLFMAGLWSVWARAGTPLLSCTIVTTAAVGDLAGIHDRMPLIVAEGDWDTWLDPDAPADDALLAGAPEVHGLKLREVSTLVNSVRNTGPELLEPATAPRNTLF